MLFFYLLSIFCYIIGMVIYMNYVQDFQNILTINDIDAYIVPTSDYHMSEYVSDYFKARSYLTGFDGSAGTLIVTKNESYLWVDGRYFIQAEKQTAGKGIEIMKIGNPNVPTIPEFLGDFFKDVKRKTLAFDGKVMPTKDVLEIKKRLSDEIVIKTDVDLVNEIWLERPKLPFSVLYRLDDSFTGRTFKDKLQGVRNKMKEYGADIHIISSLEDQAWLYNLRANDVNYTPVFLSFTIITKNQVLLFIDDKKIDLDVEKYLNSNKIIIINYDKIYD